MNLKRKCQVVMLPTTEATSHYLVLNDRNKLFSYKPNYIFTSNYLESMGYSKQHLYILSNEEIKEGDWKYNSKLNCITQHWRNNKGLPDSLKIAANYCKKIIATTDTSLRINITKPREYPTISPLPQPSPQFIQKYIEEWNKGNKIKEVMVEYEENCNYELGNCAGVEYLPCEVNCKKYWYPVLKVDKNNQITITKVKDNFTLKELKKSIYQAISCPETFVTGICCDDKKIDQWIEDNL